MSDHPVSGTVVAVEPISAIFTSAQFHGRGDSLLLNVEQAAAVATLRERLATWLRATYAVPEDSPLAAQTRDPHELGDAAAAALLTVVLEPSTSPRVLAMAARELGGEGFLAGGVFAHLDMV